MNRRRFWIYLWIGLSWLALVFLVNWSQYELWKAGVLP